MRGMVEEHTKERGGEGWWRVGRKACVGCWKERERMGIKKLGRL
jgi:hypothetical protein